MIAGVTCRAAEANLLRRLHVGGVEGRGGLTHNRNRLRVECFVGEQRMQRIELAWPDEGAEPKRCTQAVCEPSLNVDLFVLEVLRLLVHHVDNHRGHTRRLLGHVEGSLQAVHHTIVREVFKQPEQTG